MAIMSPYIPMLFKAISSSTVTGYFADLQDIQYHPPRCQHSAVSETAGYASSSSPRSGKSYICTPAMQMSGANHRL